MKRSMAFFLMVLMVFGALLSGQAAFAEGSWTGEITFYAQGYTPKTPDEINPNPPTKLQQFADEYAVAHPGVSIKFVVLAGDTVRGEWIRTQAAAGQLPDVVYEQSRNIGGQLPKEMFIAIDELLAKDDPYVPGQKWGDTFNSTVMQMTQVGDGSHYVVSGDYVETGIYYNVRMFKEAGVEGVPANWEEFIEACKKLKAAGFAPMAWSMAQDDTYALDWGNRIFLSNFYANDIAAIDIDGTPGISDVEKIVALKNGVVRVDDGKFLGFWDTLKDLTEYMNAGWSSKSDLEQKFMKEEVAMYWSGSWLPKKMVDAGVTFEYSAFPFPTPTKNTLPGISTDKVTSGAVGGPNGAFQYCISSQQANRTMSDDKLAVVADWLMYITEPNRISEIVNEGGTFSPTIVGSIPREGMGDLLKNLNADFITYDGGQGITGTTYDTNFRLMHQYLMGEITMEQAISQLTGVYAEEVDFVIESNPEWNFQQYLK